MNVVIYSTDMEPITVFDMSPDMVKALETNGTINVATVRDGSTIAICPVHAVPVIWPSGEIKYLAVTKAEELALGIQPDWLPGQRGAISFYVKGVRAMREKIIQLMRKR